MVTLRGLLAIDPTLEQLLETWRTANIYMTNMDDKAEDHVTDVSAPVAFDDVFATLEPIQEEHKGTVQPLRQPRCFS